MVAGGAILPVIELRGAIPLGVVLGLPWWFATMIAVAADILLAWGLVILWPLVIRIIEQYIPFLARLHQRFLSALTKKFQQRYARWQYWGLFLFVAIPLPGSGVWSASLLSAFLQFPKRRSLIALSWGVVVSGLLIGILTALAEQGIVLWQSG